MTSATAEKFTTTGAAGGVSDGFYPLVMTKIAMGNDPFIDGLPFLKMV